MIVKLLTLSIELTRYLYSLIPNRGDGEELYNFKLRKVVNKSPGVLSFFLGNKALKLPLNTISKKKTTLK